MTFWDQGDSKGHIKTKKFKIDNIHCVRGFLYILGDPGPWCAVPTHLQVPLLNAACTTFLKPFLNKKALHKKQYVQPGRSSLYFMRQGSAGEHANKIFRELDVNEDGELSIDEFVKGCLEDGELMMFTVRYLPLQWYLTVFKRNFNTPIYLLFHFFENLLQKRQRYFIRSNV